MTLRVISDAVADRYKPVPVLLLWLDGTYQVAAIAEYARQILIPMPGGVAVFESTGEARPINGQRSVYLFEEV